jgi:hypothetical protein
VNGSGNEVRTGNKAGDVESLGRKGLVYAIITQAYIDVKRYWKYVLKRPSPAQMSHHKVAQHNYLLREYEQSLTFFLSPYFNYGSYMEYLLSLLGERDRTIADMVETVGRMKEDVDKFSTGVAASPSVDGIYMKKNNDLAYGDLAGGFRAVTPSAYLRGLVTVQ